MCAAGVRAGAGRRDAVHLRLVRRAAACARRARLLPRPSCLALALLVREGAQLRDTFRTSAEYLQDLAPATDEVNF